MGGREMIHIVTPVTRAHNLPTMAQNLEHTEEITWWIVYDPSCKQEHKKFHIPENVSITVMRGVTRTVGGNLHRNLALGLIHPDSRDWFLSLDDDNIIVPGFLDELTEDRNAIVVQQLNKDGSFRLPAGLPRVNYIDLAQYAIRRHLIGNIRYENRYEADGIFAEAVYTQHPDGWTFINKPLSYWNYLT